MSRTWHTRKLRRGFKRWFHWFLHDIKCKGIGRRVPKPAERWIVWNDSET